MRMGGGGVQRQAFQTGTQIKVHETRTVTGIAEFATTGTSLVFASWIAGRCTATAASVPEA